MSKANLKEITLAFLGLVLSSVLFLGVCAAVSLLLEAAGLLNK
jgi:hypothetical protein